MIDLTPNPISGMSSHESNVLDDLRMIASAGVLGGPALVKIAEDLGKIIQGATFPALTVEEVTDDGETFTALRCPTCGNLVDEEELAVAENAERWSTVSTDGIDFDRSLIEFDYSDRPDFDNAGYYMHGDLAGGRGRTIHPVTLPDGWRVRS